MQGWKEGERYQVYEKEAADSSGDTYQIEDEALFVNDSRSR